MAIKTRQLKNVDLRELNSILENIYREINNLNSLVSKQDNKALSEPSGSLRIEQDEKSEKYFLEIKSKNGWARSSTAEYKLKEN